MQKLFTLDEANGLLPRLIPIIERMRTNRRRIDELDESVAAAAWHVRRNGHDVDERAGVRRQAERDDLVAALQRDVAEVQALGLELKDFELGLIDFPSEREGRIVYLCWKLGEPQVAYWHDLDAGYAGRQPL